RKAFKWHYTPASSPDKTLAGFVSLVEIIFFNISLTGSRIGKCSTVVIGLRLLGMAGEMRESSYQQKQHPTIIFLAGAYHAQVNKTGKFKSFPAALLPVLYVVVNTLNLFF